MNRQASGGLLVESATPILREHHLTWLPSLPVNFFRFSLLSEAAVGSHPLTVHWLLPARGPCICLQASRPFLTNTTVDSPLPALSFSFSIHSPRTLRQLSPAPPFASLNLPTANCRHDNFD